MTSGLPPDAAVRLRAGAFGPPAVAAVLSLPVWLVFAGTVLLSLMLRWGRVDRSLWTSRRCGLPDAVPGSRNRVRLLTPPTPAGAASDAPRRGTGSARPA